jgi:hypothetical protein
MTVRAINWPKLIGAFVIVLGIALSLRGSAFLFDSTIDPFGPVRAYLWPLVAVGLGSIASLIIGLAAYRRHEWARRALIGITALAILLCLVYAYFDITRSISAMGRLEPQWVFWTRLLFVGEALRAVCPPIFFLLILLHQDVARCFKPAATPTI